MDSNSFGHGYFSEGFIKSDLDDSIFYVSCLIVDNNFTSIRWHHKLRILQTMYNWLVKKGPFSGHKKMLDIYDSILVGEAHRKPFSKSHRASHPLDLLHYDIYRPMIVNVMVLLISLHH